MTINVPYISTDKPLANNAPGKVAFDCSSAGCRVRRPPFAATRDQKARGPLREN